jgi:LuxR family maltose regulon positive regulatory protein
MTVAVDRSNCSNAFDAGLPATNHGDAQRLDEAHGAIGQAPELEAIALGPRGLELPTCELKRALGYLALIAAERGHLAAAQHQIRRATGGDTELADAAHFVNAMVSLATATVLAMRGEAAAAADAAHPPVVLARKGAGIVEVVEALLLRAEMLEDLSDHGTAEASPKKTGTLPRGCPAGITTTLSTAVGQRVRGRGVPRNKGRAVREELTSKELEILRLLVTPLSRRAIGQRLYVSLNTVKTHQRGVYRKLGVDNRSAAVGRARELGLL